MTLISNHLPTAELQALDAAHHLHPFTHGNDLEKKGVRVITRAQGVTLTDSDGNEMLDAMAGLWCVNLGYGHHELAEAAARQMKELPYYNTFFQTTHVPAIALSEKIASLTPYDLNHVFYASSGSEANDTNIRIVRTYWDEKGHPAKKKIISRVNAYHGSSMGSGSLGGMTYMHVQGGMPIADIHHIGQPDWYMEGGDMDPDEFGLARCSCWRSRQSRLHRGGA
ncbi:MAG: aminotransferase class III-fold pyridoxal phosphate-dependent enzyme, partial [Pseudomonadota bacterium]